MLGFVFQVKRHIFILFMAVLCHDSETTNIAPGGNMQSLHARSSIKLNFKKMTKIKKEIVSGVFSNRCTKRRMLNKIQNILKLNNYNQPGT